MVWRCVLLILLNNLNGLNHVFPVIFVSCDFKTVAGVYWRTGVTAIGFLLSYLIGVALNFSNIWFKVKLIAEIISMPLNFKNRKHLYFSRNPKTFPCQSLNLNLTFVDMVSRFSKYCWRKIFFFSIQSSNFPRKIILKAFRKFFWNIKETQIVTYCV